MNLLMKFLVLMFFIACATQAKKPGIEQEINGHEVKSLKEVQTHLEMIIDAHPELSSNTKIKIISFIQETLHRQQLLKDEESKVVQLMLGKSLGLSEEKIKNSLVNKELKKRLIKIYESKSENIFQLISNISEMSIHHEINDHLKQDMELFMRDFR
jgi:hypothetical protein